MTSRPGTLAVAFWAIVCGSTSTAQTPSRSATVAPEIVIGKTISETDCAPAVVGTDIAVSAIKELRVTLSPPRWNAARPSASPLRPRQVRHRDRRR
jgi:hypothetical protein